MSLSEILSGAQELDEKNVESIIEKIIDKLLDEKNFLQLTDLTDGEIQKLAELLAIADILNIVFIKKYIKYLLLLKISKKRAGRRELLNAIKYLAVLQHGEEEKNNIVRRVLRL